MNKYGTRSYRRKLRHLDKRHHWIWCDAMCDFHIGLINKNHNRSRNKTLFNKYQSHAE